MYVKCMCLLTDDIIERQIEEGMISPDLRDKINFVLLRKHRHQTKKPIHRSLADMGKSGSSGSEYSFIYHQGSLCSVLRKSDQNMTTPMLRNTSSTFKNVRDYFILLLVLNNDAKHIASQ